MKKIIKVMLVLCVSMMWAMSTYATEGEMVYEYGDEGIVNESVELSVPVTAGKDYSVTVEFTGVTDAASKINLGYDMVINDQMVPNVDGSNDRSGLIDETVVAGTVESRTFSVAATSDTLTIKANGSGKITKITVKPLEIKKEDKTVIFTIGDSLVQTYTDYYAPQTGWGQTLQDYFDANKVVVANHALGGRSSGSFMREGRLNQVLINVKPGDFVLVEFGHNDASKDKVDRYTSVEDYKLYLKEQYIIPIEQRGGIPVLVTLCNRNDYNQSTGQFNVSFERYVVAMREVAEETGTLLVDLNARTVKEFTELNNKYGIGITEEIIFNHADAGEYDGAYADGVADNTHLQKYGAKLVGGFVAEGLCELDIDVLKDAYVASAVSGDKPSTPSNLQALSKIRTLRKIGWDECKGADFYQIYVAEVVDGKTGEYELVGLATTNSYVYGKADAKATYKFKVVAVNGAGESKESEELLYEPVGGKKNKVNEETTATMENTDEGGLNAYVIIGIVAAIVVVVGVVAGVVVKKKKKLQTGR